MEKLLKRADQSDDSSGDERLRVCRGQHQSDEQPSRSDTQLLLSVAEVKVSLELLFEGYTRPAQEFSMHKNIYIGRCNCVLL